MRPLRLTMVAFGPYAGTETVDFDALTDLGLFVVAGNNGSGKTTIFDALHYALFGTLPGRRAQYIRLKSDHADDKVECVVTLDFAAHGKHWRVERSPKQKRPKRRGTGSTEVERRATLYRLAADHGEPATAVANKIGEVDERCRDLVGLSGKQFERVALLPQGEFSRVLRESSTDRRELLRTLFSSEIFDDATALLTEQAAEATAADRSVLDRIDHQQQALAQDLVELVGHPVANVPKALTDAIVDYRRTHVHELIASATHLEQQAAAATTAHQAACDIGLRMRRRAQVELELDAHENAREQHLDDLARLDQGRAAVPVASQAQTHADQQQRLAKAKTHHDELRDRLQQALAIAGVHELENTDDATLARAGVALQTLADQLNERAVVALQVDDLDALTKRVHGDLRRKQNELTALADQLEIARAQHRQAESEYAKLVELASTAASTQDLLTAQADLEQRLEFDAIETEHQQLIGRARELDDTVSHLQAAHEQAHQAQTSHLKLQAKADAAFQALDTSTQRSEAARSYHEANAQLLQARTVSNDARVIADGLWDAFIAGTAARVAQALVDDEPCPVCGSNDHPAPAELRDGDTIVTEAEVADARNRSEHLQTELRAIEARIEALRQHNADIASLSLVELDAEISTAKAMALGAQTAADEAHREAAQYEVTATKLAEARRARASLTDQLREIDEQRNQRRGALGDVAVKPLHELQTHVESVAKSRAAADELNERQAELHHAITQNAQNIEAIELEQLAAESRRSSAADQLAQRQADQAAATTALQQIEQRLARANFANRHTAPEPNYEQRTAATRRAQNLVGELTTAAALQSEATLAARRAQSMLTDRLHQSSFTTVDQALAAFADPSLIAQLDAHVSAYVATGDRLKGQLHELADLPTQEPDLQALSTQMELAANAHAEIQHQLIATTTNLDRIEAELHGLIAERQRCQTTDLTTRRLERVAALVKGDNDRNTSLENWVLAAHLRDVVELANVRLARSTHQRFQLCVLDDGENKRGRWGLDLGVEDTVTGTRRPTAGLSGGELFQASLALALGLADAVMNQSAGVRIDALFIDEGFGSLDETSVERAIDLLDELRDQGAMVGVITHVPALLDALPLGVTVVDATDGPGSTIQQRQAA